MMGIRQRIRVRKHNAYKVKVCRQNGCISLTVAAFFLYAALTSTGGGVGIVFLMGVMMVWRACCDFRDADMYDKRIGGVKQYKKKPKGWWIL